MSYTPVDYPPVKGLYIHALNDPRLVERIKIIDKCCLPVTYTSNYYEQNVTNGLHQYNQIAFYHDILVGSITCRLQRDKDSNETYLYIMTICVLEAYRGLGIGKRLLCKIMDEVHRDTSNTIACIRLHMQVGSPVASFYEKYGFTVERTEKDYYDDLDEHDALVLRRVIPQVSAGGKKGGK